MKDPSHNKITEQVRSAIEDRDLRVSGIEYEPFVNLTVSHADGRNTAIRKDVAEEAIEEIESEIDSEYEAYCASISDILSPVKSTSSAGNIKVQHEEHHHVLEGMDIPDDPDKYRVGE
ncbi:hypothetical protein CV102_17700 [Natronococcus pandeyae]|uniref:Uncharacterized protein n=1 Tax=Natronococcus pandeyae TaxID=2055836 RepID=A0A8J8Q584_9EURY|nr:hypothetical protein [Natronococcus pandeyae]TYL37440.1 hypothetical protein CV102_17700 [Natronococcus pandeyae]